MTLWEKTEIAKNKKKPSSFIWFILAFNRVLIGYGYDSFVV